MSSLILPLENRLTEGRALRVNAQLRTWWLAALSLLVALMPLSFAVSWHVKVLPATLLLLAGLGLLLSSPATRRSFANARLVVVACALALLYPALNILGHRLGWNTFDRPSHILLYMATAAVFSLPLRMRWVWIGYSLTAILLGTVCIVQHYVFGIARAYGLNGGDWGAIEFAMFMLSLSLMATVQVFHATASRPEKALHAAAAVFGMYGALLTQSRGPLLAFVPIFLLLLLTYARRTGHWRRSLLLIVVVVCGGVLAGASVHGVVLDRFAAVGSEMASYDHHTDATGAVRERLEMWRTAGHAILDHPLEGVGIDQFGVYVRQQVASGHANPVISKYDHPHSEYLEWAATGGVPGLLVLLSIFGLPLVYFARHARQADSTVMVAAYAGLAVVGMYALCAFSDNVFYRAMPHSLYFFLVLGLAVLIGSRTPANEAFAR
ncbi:MAG TPA: O-antigen ligase family protein [Rhodanobacter sp.]